MPQPEYKSRYQTAVFWPKIGVDRYGQVIIGSPVEIQVQWHTTKSQVQDHTGATITLDATAIIGQDVIPGLVNNTMLVGSRLWFGTLNQYYAEGSGGPLGIDTQVMEVKTYTYQPDIRNRAKFRSVGLMRWRNPGAQ